MMCGVGEESCACTQSLHTKLRTCCEKSFFLATQLSSSSMSRMQRATSFSNCMQCTCGMQMSSSHVACKWHASKPHPYDMQVRTARKHHVGQQSSTHTHPTLAALTQVPCGLLAS